MISIIGEEISRASPFPCCDVCESPLQHSDYSLEIRAIIQTVSELPLSGEKKVHMIIRFCILKMKF